MNRRTVRLLADGLIAIVLALVLRYLADYLSNTIIVNETLNLSIINGVVVLPFIWLALRYGTPTSIVFAAITGFIQIFLFASGMPFIQAFLVEVTPLLTSGLAGLFAKYTQKTLNNRRLKSTYLNIVTASLIVVFLYIALKTLMLILTMSELPWSILTNNSLWIGLIVSWLIVSLILIVMAKTNPKLIIPKRSKFLTRKETSSLLND